MRIHSMILMLGLSLMSCKKDESAAKTIRVSSLTSISAYAGENRIKLVWAIPTDDQITKCRIYWGSDSIDVPLPSHGDRDSTIISNLPEGTYTFSVAALDKNDNLSNRISVKSTAYGDKYAISLKNRAIKSISYNEAQHAVTVNLLAADPGVVTSEIRYKDSNSVDHSVFVPSYYAQASLPGFSNNSKDSILLYRTGYLPQLAAIDTFFTAFDTIRVIFPSDEGQSGEYTRAELQADGPGDTYELINSVLGGTAEETPDCSHPAFGRHIAEEYNDELKENVFAFYLHVTPDNDRCVNFDRQRCEIKTYGPSPDSLKGFNGDEMIFEWKFRLPDGFQPSSSFTHIHQIKAGDGPNDGSPLITLTPRYGHPDQLQIIHTGDNSSSSQGTVKQVDLAPFLGTWVQATEKIKFGTHGSYSLELKRISDGSTLLSYINNDIDLWRTGSTFIRPKWGIYRSLNHPEQLRDEKVLFADFVIQKKK